VLMNVHRSELGYLEWQRTVEAMVNGCVLLSEHSLGFEPLVAGEHFASVSFDSLDVALEALLSDEDRLARMRASAYAFLRNEYPLSSSIQVLSEAVSDVASRPTPAVAGLERETFPRPKPPGVPLTEHERILKGRTDLDIVRMAVKQLLLDQRETRRALRDLQTTLSGEEPTGERVERFGSRRLQPPRVSVVLTVFNYAALVGSAIESVVASEFMDYELVIVDDESNDGSGDAIRRALSGAPSIAATLITRSRNRGLAHARNLGAETATGDLLFILDADNAIYPHTLGRLTQAMDEDQEAAFAYGIIEQFAVDGPTSLMSYLGWDPARLRHGNFIDAMAMVRRSALLEVGGYVTDPRLYGWEDFALWCSFADRGWSGVQVPEIIARYRLALHSMISLTNIDASAVWSLLLDRFRCLAPSPVA
jgi:hypothetical protein